MNNNPELTPISYKPSKKQLVINGYIKAIYTETLMIPVIRGYDILALDKVTVIRHITQKEAKDLLDTGRIIKLTSNENQTS